MNDSQLRPILIPALLFFLCAGALVIWGIRTDASMGTPVPGAPTTDFWSVLLTLIASTAGLGLLGCAAFFLPKLIRSIQPRLTTNDIRAAQPVVPEPTTSARLILGLTGIALLIVGVFLPFVTAPIVGHINYFRNGRGDGVLVLILAGISLYAVLRGSFRWLWATGILSAGLILFTTLNLSRLLSKFQSEAGSAKNEFANKLISGFAESVQLDYGVAVMAIGIILLFVTAGYRQPAPVQTSAPPVQS